MSRMPSELDHVMSELVRQWGEAKVQSVHVANYNGANLAYNHAANIANNLKLSDEQKSNVVPFPSPTSSTTIVVGPDQSQPSVQAEASSDVRPAHLPKSSRAAMVLALIATVAAAGTAGWFAEQAVAPGDSAPVVSAEPDGSDPGSVGYQVR